MDLSLPYQSSRLKMAERSRAQQDGRRRGKIPGNLGLLDCNNTDRPPGTRQQSTISSIDRHSVSEEPNVSAGNPLVEDIQEVDDEVGQSRTTTMAPATVTVPTSRERILATSCSQIF